MLVAATAISVPHLPFGLREVKSAAAVDALPTSKAGATSSDAEIARALAEIGADQATLRLSPGIWAVANDLTIPANINLKMERGGVLAIADNKTLTINGTLECGLGQCFSCSGSGRVLFGPGEVNEVFPEWWGAKGDGVTDSTNAITAAWNACVQSTDGVPPNYLNFRNPVLRFGFGDYIFSGNGLGLKGSYANVAVLGNGPGSTRIKLTSNNYFINTDYIYSLRLEGLEVLSGKGAVRQYGTSPNVAGFSIINNCYFTAYTECAVGFNSVDKPYVKVSNCIFYGAKNANTIGIALSYEPAGSDLANCAFMSNRYHIKIPFAGGAGVFIHHNDFIRFDPDGPIPCYDIWVVPNAQAWPGGVIIKDNKFGNERLQDNDVRILIADEDSGSDNMTKFHSTRPSSGFVWHITVVDNTFENTATNTKPYILSYCPKFYDLKWENFYYADFVGSGTNPILGFTYPLDEKNPWNRTHSFDYRQSYGALNHPALDPCSEYGMGAVNDPFGYLQGRLEFPHHYPGSGSDPGYVKLLTDDDILNDNPGGRNLFNAAQTAAVDAVGGANAVMVQYTAEDGMIWLGVNPAYLAPGRHGWVEFDVKAAPSNPLTELLIQLHPTDQNDWSQVSLQRVIKVPAMWTRVRFSFATRKANGLLLRIRPHGYGSKKNSVLIGRPAIYYAQEPVNLTPYPEGIALKIRTSEPHVKFQGMIVIADRANWDPLGKNSGGPYIVWYNGSAWKPMNSQ